MLTKNFQSALYNWSVQHSGHESRRDYIGLSGIGECEQVIYDRYMSGQHLRVEEHLLHRFARELEAALVERVRALGCFAPGEEITLYNGLVQGHTDGLIGGTDILEIKTVPQERHLPERGRLPRRVFHQVQAYMHYLERRWTHVIYLARDTGLVQVYGVSYQAEVGEEIERRVERLAQAVKDYRRPACTCGRCESKPSPYPPESRTGSGPTLTPGPSPYKGEGSRTRRGNGRE